MYITSPTQDHILCFFLWNAAEHCAVVAPDATDSSWLVLVKRQREKRRCIPGTGSLKSKDAMA